MNIQNNFENETAIALRLSELALNSNSPSSSNASNSSSSSLQTVVDGQQGASTTRSKKSVVVKEGYQLHDYLNVPIPQSFVPLADQVEKVEKLRNKSLLPSDLWALVFEYTEDPLYDNVAGKIRACTNIKLSFEQNSASFYQNLTAIKQSFIDLYRWKNVKPADICLRILYSARTGILGMNDLILELRHFKRLLRVDPADLTRIHLPSSTGEKPQTEQMPPYSKLCAASGIRYTQALSSSHGDKFIRARG